MRVQRTRSSASAPRSPLTRYPLGRPFHCAAILLLLCSALRADPVSDPPAHEELAIILAALEGPWEGLDHTWPSAHLYRKTQRAWVGSAPEETNFWRGGAVRQEDLNFSVPGELMRQLPKVNEAAISLAPLKQERFKLVDLSTPPDGAIAVSRPTISRDGLAAVVAIAHWTWGDRNGSGGYTAYLEKKNGRWSVVGYSNVWTI